MFVFTSSRIVLLFNPPVFVSIDVREEQFGSKSKLLTGGVFTYMDRFRVVHSFLLLLAKSTILTSSILPRTNVEKRLHLQVGRVIIFVRVCTS